MSPKILSESSTRYAREKPRAGSMWQLAAMSFVFCLLTIPVPAVGDEPTPEDRIEFNIPQQRADLALTQFAEQANLTLLFPFDGVRDRMANALTGEYTLDEAIEVLLAGTGLTPTFKNALVLDIAIDSDPTLDEDSMDTKKKAGVVAVLAGVLAGGVNAQEPTVTETEIQTSVVTGTVTDARTGANLKGAKVTIKETGQWVSTDDRGQFQFFNVTPGNYMLRVSFLGYAEQSAAISVDGESPNVENFALRGGTEIEEIVVFGTRSARAQSLNQERTAKNFTTVLASDFLGNFTGDTISEALRLAPGVAFEQDPLTGEGTNIIIRGLEPDLNTVTLNGLRLPEASGFGRSADLGNILTESVSSVTISKTLLPSQDSSGTGGLIDIETKSPLDRKSRFFSIGLKRIERNEGFGDGFFASSTVSGLFGSDENFGASLSAQYRETETRSISYRTRSLYNPVGPGLNGLPTRRAFVDPTTPFPFDREFAELYPERATVGDGTTTLDNFSTGATIAYDMSDHTSLRFDVHYFDESRTSFDSVQDTEAFIIGGRDVPIDELGGEVRTVLTWEDGVAAFGLPGFLISTGREASYVPDSKTDTITAGFSGDTALDRWELDYQVGYARSETDTPRRFSVSTLSNGSRFFGFEQISEEFVSPEAFEATFDDRVIALYGPRPDGEAFPSALLSTDGFSAFNDPSNYQLASATLTEGLDGENERWTARASFTRFMDNDIFRSLSGGFFYEEATFRSGQDFTESQYRALQQGLGGYGLRFSDATTKAIGVDPALAFGGLSQNTVIGLLDSLDTLSFGQMPLLSVNEILSDERDRDSLTEETEFSAFLELEAQLGKLEIIGGLRVVNVESRAVDSSNSTFIDEDGEPDLQFIEDSIILFDESVNQTEILPRILANYRFTENNILRMGYFATVARPQIGLLSAPQTVVLDLQPRYGPNRNQPRLFIRESNPDLKPAYTHNFDVSFENYSQLGTFQVSVFYKEIENLLQSNSDVDLSSIADVRDLPDDPRFTLSALPGNLFVEGSRPANSKDSAEIWGIELAGERQLTFLPGAFDGLGIFANYTYTDSERSDVLEFRNAPIEFDADGRPIAFERQLIDVKVPFGGQPEHSGTAALTYNKYNIDASLSYSVQSRRLTSGLEPFGLNEYEDEVETLDLRAEYRLERPFGTVRFFVEVLDLLKGAEEAGLTTSVGGEDGVSKYNVAGRYFGGRSFQFGVAATF